jgi:predicted nucleic acid-binding protein
VDNSSLVVDASVTLAWAFEDECNAYCELVLESLAEVSACVPHIWPLEVGNALLAAERREQLKQVATVQFLSLLWQLPIGVEPERPERLLGEVLALAREQSISTYDASYLYLAMRRGLPLATTDEKVRQAAVRAGVVLFGS